MSAAESCPSCEFNKKGSGHPVSLGSGLMICAFCKSKWRVLNSKTVVMPANTAVKLDVETQISTRNMVSQSSQNRTSTLNHDADHSSIRMPEERSSADEHSGFSSFKSISKTYYAMVAFIPIAAFLGVHAFSWVNKTAPDHLEIVDISLRKLVASQGPAVKILGTIRNNSGEIQPVNSIQLVLYSKEGQKLHEWNYKPALGEIAARSELQFASAVGNFFGDPDRVEVTFSDAL